MAEIPVESNPSTLHITVLSAGAGSGKTFTLTGKMVELLQSGVRAGGIVATTFTQKAAAELQERVRVRLLEAGMSEAANELGSALIGTVHSIGTRLLQRFAFEAGVSPLVEIIAENDGQRLFNESLAQVLSEARIEKMNLLADRLGLTKKSFGDPFDWRRAIREITDVARANNFSRKVLETSKIQSWESFEALLPPRTEYTDFTNWRKGLLEVLNQTVESLEQNSADTTQSTQKGTDALREFQNQLKQKEDLYWHEYVKIRKTTVGARSRELLEPLHAYVDTHDTLPEFRSDIQSFINLIFDISMDALGEFEAYKQKRGLIDYTDMETYVSRLLRMDSVRATLADEIDLLLVDEFQDTSPIQLDIFLQLSRLAKNSIWVGDPKQSIYGFRGAEPALMQAIIEASGGIQPEHILKKSWRSRQDIVHAVNAIFTKAFPQMPAEQVALEAVSTREKEQELLEHYQPGQFPGDAYRALIHWRMLNEQDERKRPGAPWMENAIAAQIEQVLNRKTPVFNKKRSELRPIQPGDIAVLCRNNNDCQQVAEALHRIGIPAAIARSGLLETHEVRLVLACLQYLLTASDALSAAEIALMTGAQNLAQLVDDRIQFLHRNENASNNWLRDDPFLAKLNRIRPQTAQLSASELINLLLDELEIRRIAAQWGQAMQRLDNLDRLRFYALEYESACNRLHAAATLGGFLLWLRQLADTGQDKQGAGDSPEAVKVLTYHRSKGLEFPLTVCHNLDQGLKEQIWGINLVSELPKPDLNDILGGRWLRFWVNPYADQLRDTRLETALHEGPAWDQARRTALEEEARLLYVGLTRARDYLVFPTSVRETKWLNRVFHKGDESIPTLDAFSDETPFYWQNQVLYCQLETHLLPSSFPEHIPDPKPLPFHPPRKGRKTGPATPRWIDTNTEAAPGTPAQFSAPLPFAAWLEFKQPFTPEMGKAVNKAFAAVFPGISAQAMLNIAQQQIALHELHDSLRPQALAHQMDAWQQFVFQGFKPDYCIARYPLETQLNGRQLKMELDWFCANAQEVQVFAFAPFAEGMKKWQNAAQVYAQTGAWARVGLLPMTTDKKQRYWVIFPFEGQALELFF
ncbi:MAG: UvrD-helicase domain-containing protein [Bacteroidetes bacterium]|nr:UvrD-helicase domain-containing protein [Bacteroidota bacterium]